MKDKDLSSDIPGEYTVWLVRCLGSYAGRGYSEMEMGVANARYSPLWFPVLVRILVGRERVSCRDDLTFYNHYYLRAVIGFFDVIII